MDFTQTVGTMASGQAGGDYGAIKEPSGAKETEYEMKPLDVSVQIPMSAQQVLLGGDKSMTRLPTPAALSF